MRTLCSLLLLLCAASVASEAFAQPQILYYKFDETSGSLARNNANPGQGWANGALSAPPIWNTATPQIGPAALNNIGQGRRLNTGYSMSERNAGQAFTIELWFRCSSNGYQDFCNDSNTFGIWMYNGTIQVYMNGGIRLSSTGGLNDGNWHYMALTRGAGNSLDLYWGNTTGGLNNASTTYNMTFSSNALGVLYWQGTAPATYNGEMDEFRLWSVQRTSTELNANRFASFPTGDYEVFDPTGLFVKNGGVAALTNVPAASPTNHTFSINNLTGSSLSFAATPISLSSPTGCTATVTANPSTVGGGGTTTFTVQVTPQSAEWSVVVSVNPAGGATPNPYQFTFTGMVNTGRPEMLYYRFNEGSGGTTRNDASPGRGTNPATFTTGPSWTSTGNARLGNSAVQNNSDLPTGFSCTDLPRPEFTLEFWIWRNNNNTVTICGDNAAFRVYRTGNGGNHSLRIQSGPAGGDQDVNTGVSLNNNAWTHIAIVSDPGAYGVRVYKDGNTTPAYENVNYTFPFVDAELHVMRNGTAGGNFSGRLDEFRFWAQARSAAQINANYQNEMVGHLQVERPSGTIKANGGTDALGTVTAGSPQNLTYTLRNTGNTGLLMGNPGVSSSATVNCTVNVTTNPSGVLIPASNTGTAVVSVTPTTAGAFSCQLLFASNDPDVPSYTLTVSGTATGTPVIQLERPSGTIKAHNGSDTVAGTMAGLPTVLTYTIRNTGVVTLNISGQSASSLVNCGVVVSPPASTSVAGGATTTMQVTVTPTAAGAFSFVLNVSSNAPAIPTYVVNVGGTAVNPPQLSATSPVNYGNSNVGVQTAPVNHTINNTGGAPLTITSISIIGTNAADWALVSPPATPLVIAAGNNQAIQGRFTPSATGARTAQLRLVSDHGGVPNTITLITLQGNGTLAAASVTTPVNYGSSNVGVATAPVGHSLTNSGSGPMTITSVSVGGDWSLSGVPGLPATVNAAGTFNFSGIFTPTATGARNATIQISWNQGGGVGPQVTNIVVNGNGTLAAASVTSPVNYGSSNVGVATAPVGHTLTNTGSGPMTITAVTVGGDWSLTGVPGLPATVNAAGTFNFSGIFTPTATGARNATIQISWNQGGGVGPQVTNIVVNGNGTLANIGVTTPVNYGSSNVGIAAPAQNHIVNNTGSGSMTITAISVSAGDWALSGLPALPATVAAGGNVNFNGIFTPTALGARSATITVTWNQGGGVGSTMTPIVVNGTGTQAVLSVTTPVAYGTSNVGVSTAPINHLVSNTGSGPLQITAIALTGANPGDWALGVLPSLPASVNAGGNVNFDAVFTPTATGARTANISITWNQGAGSTITAITLNGNGTQAAASVTSPVNYGSSNVGVATAPVGHTLTNSGSGPMTITSVSVGGDWSLSGVPGLPATVNAAGTFNFSGIFTPTATGARNATIQISWNQGGGIGPQVTNIVVNGNGTQATASVTSPVNYGSSNVGVATAPVGHTLTNTGSGPMTINAVSVGGDWSLTGVPGLPATVNAAGTFNFSGIFTPTATGARNATIQISWNQGGGVGPQVTNIVVNGNGTLANIGVTTPVNYGSSNIGIAAPTQNHVVNNTGSGPMTITAISVSAGDWVLNNLPALPANVPFGGSVNFDGVFTPTALGARNATITITWDQGGGVGSTMTPIAVNGTGTQAALSVTTPVNFGSSNIGVSTAPTNHVLDNTGSGPLQVTAIALAGANPGDWALGVLPGLPATINAGSNIGFDSVFTPTTTGARTAIINITWNQGAGSTITPITLNGTGTQATANVTSPVNYGSSNVGVATAPVGHTLTNSGSGPMTITAVSVGGDWSLSGVPGLPATVNAAGTFNFNGIFTPTATGARNATIQISWNQGGGVGPQVTNIVLNGTGTLATASVTTPINYGSSNVGVATAPVGHTLTNTGSGPMSVTAVTVGGDWSLSGVPGLPATVNAAGTFNFNGIFTPTATGARNATIQISWNQGGGVGPQVTNIVVNGNGTLAAASVTTPVNYGSSNVGVATAPVGHTLTNSGSGPMTITSVSVGGDWLLTGVPGLPATVNAAGTFNFNGIFTPTATGARNATIQISWNQGGGVGPQVTNIVVDGNGTVGSIGVTSPINYGSSNVGVATAPINHVVNSTGSGPIEITAIAATGDWAVANLPALPATVASLSSVNFDGIFTPTAVGARNGTLDITWNQGGGIGSTMTSIIVNGTGTAGSVTLSNNGNYGSVATGMSSSPVTHTITNNGTGAIRILGVSTAGADAAFWSLSGTPPVNQVLVPTAFWNFSGQFSPTAVRAYSAQLVVDWDNGPSTTPQQTSIGLSGNGVLGSAVTSVQVGPDDGGPVRVQGDVSGPAASLVDVTVTYTGGNQGGTPGAAVISMVVGGYTVVGNVIQAVPEGTTLVFYWDAYATEGHTTASDYVITLSPAVSGVPGTLGSSSMFTLTRQGGWTRYNPVTGSPGLVSEHTMIRDVAHDRLVVFGGYRNGVLSNETWEFVYATSSWRLLTPTGTPPSPRREVLGAYDAAHNQMLIFGGQSATGDTNDTFALDLTPGAESWTQIASVGTRPSIRTHGTLIVDTPNNRAILYGGYHASAVLQDVWALDLTPGSENWGSGALTTVNPPAFPVSIGNASIYDPIGARMLVYRPYQSQLWEMTLGATPTWTNLTPAGGPMFARYPAVAYDSLRHAMILQGGLTSTASLTETWSLDIATMAWSQLPDEPNSGGRFWHSGAYDETRDQFVMLGGRNFARVQNATLAVLSLASPATWLTAPDALSDAAGPAGRTGAVMVNDAVNNRVLLFGGLTANGYVNDLWALDRNTPGPWVRLSQAGSIPVARGFAAACYDSANQRVMLFGGQGGTGYLDDVWTLDVNTLAWQQWSATPGPTARALTSVVCDPSGGRMLVFGGQGSAKTNDYWEFDFAHPPATRWSQPTTLGAAPTARCGHGATFDSTNNRMVVFCGETPTEQNDVWALDYSLPTPTWLNITPGGTQPLARTRFASAAASGGSLVYIHAGKRAYMQLADTWELDLTNPIAAWTSIATSAGAPNERIEHAGCLDNAGLFVVGMGKYGIGPVSDVWEIDCTAPTPAYNQLAVPSTPPNLAYAQSAYDPVGNRMIVFSGVVNGANSSALWQLDLSTSPPSWSLLSASGTAPVGRTGASFVYDAGHSPPRILMYGGRLGTTAATTVDELWALELNPGTEQWVQLTAYAGIVPLRRSFHSAIVDGAGNMIMFGGADVYGSASASLMRLDLNTLVWTSISAGGTAPSARMYPRAIYDGQSGRNRMLVFGGYGFGSFSNQLFELNLNSMTWTQLGSMPPAGAWGSMVHDAAGERFILYGGCGTAAQSGLYTFDLTTDTWAQVNPPSTTPQARWGHSAVWDSATNRLVVVGGSGGTYSQPYYSSNPLTEQSGTIADTWFWGD